MKNATFILLVCCLAVQSVRAQNRLDSLERVYSSALADTLKILALADIAFQYRGNRPDTCIQLAKQALAESEAIGFGKGRGRSLNIIGTAFLNKGAYVEAMACFNEALGIQQAIDDQKGEALTLNNIGLIHDLQGNYPLALEHYQQSLHIQEQINDVKNLTISLNNIGVVYFMQGNYAQALSYYQKNLEQDKKNNDLPGMATSLENIALVHSVQEDYEAALGYQKESLQIRLAINDSAGMAAGLYNTGNIYFKKGEQAQAKDYFENSLSVAEKIGDSYATVYPLNGLAQIHRHKGDFARSAAYAAKGLAIAEELKALGRINMFSKTLYQIHKDQGNYRKALEFHELYQQTDDSLFSIEKEKMIANLETKAEIEKLRLSEERSRAENQAKTDQITMMEKEKSLLTSINVLAVSALAVSLVFAAYVILSLRKEKKAKQIIVEQHSEIAALNENLEALVKQRTNKLEDQNAKLTQYAFYNAHVLRRPVATILGLNNLLEIEKNEAERAIILGHLNSTVLELDKTIRQIQDIVDQEKTKPPKQADKGPAEQP